jgi:CRP/FNR family nitrogen fixation transcriptional regulator
MPARMFAIAQTSTAAPSPADSGAELNLIGVACSFARDRAIFSEGDRADQVFKVVSGAVRAVRTLTDGRRHIEGFHLPGDVFGVELGAERRATAEALRDTVVVVASRAGLTAEPALSGGLCRHALAQLQRAQDHLLTLGRRTARERLACFILDLAARTGARPELDLPMSRQDIADYLGLTIETVSRGLTQMQAQGLVRASGRRLRILRRDALAELCA